MVERPLMSLLRASFIRLSLLCDSSDACDIRECPWRDSAARLAESERAVFFARDDVLLPEPPCFSPPPDCLFVLGLAFLRVRVLVFVPAWHGIYSCVGCMNGLSPGRTDEPGDG